MVSKRLDKWRRDISESVGSACQKDITFQWNVLIQNHRKKYIFSTFSSVFLWIFQMSKSQTVSITGRRMFASTLGRARLFTPMNSSSAKIHESVARLLRQPIHGFGCVAHKRIYSQWLQRHMMPSVFFVATPERNATATQKEPLWWDGF